MKTTNFSKIAARYESDSHIQKSRRRNCSACSTSGGTTMSWTSAAEPEALLEKYGL